jgi:PAS domain S-box-containing protein
MNILIVDDDPTSLKLLHVQLESEGHAVFEAHDGVDALALLNRQRVDAVISDILMPRMDGYRLCHEIRKDARLHDLPIIIYSATYTSPDDETLALDMGADKYLKKPVPVETIITALLEVIAKPHAAPQPKALQEVEVLQIYNERLVSKLKEKNTKLQAAAVKFRALVEQSIVGIYIVQDDQFVYVNPKMAGILGWSEEEITSRTVYDFVVPEDHTLARENIRKRISGEVSSLHYDLRMLHQSGAVLQVEVHSSRADYNGRPAVMGTLLDITARKEAETKLRESEARLRQLSSAIEQTADTVIITDREGTIQYVNAAFEGMTGYSAAEAVGRKPSLLKSGQHTPEFYEQLWRTITTGAPFRAVFVNRRKNGALIHEEETITPIKDERGNITHFVSTAKDITERRQAEAALQQSEARLQEAQRIARLGNWEWDLTTDALYWSDEIYRIFELTPQQFGATYPAFLERVHPLDRSRIIAAVDAAVHAAAPYDIDHRIVLSDGRERTVHENGFVFRDETGRSLRMVGTVQDITERKQAEEALLKAAALQNAIFNEQARLVAIIDATPDFVSTSDLEGHVLYCNQAGLRMLGFEPGHDASGLRIRESHPEWAAKLVLETGIPHAIEHGSWTGETAFLRTDGREVPISQVILAHRGTDGSVEYLSTIARDMSMEHRLEQAQRINSLGRVAATIAHEFNNVLMGIQPFAEIIRRRASDDEGISKATEQISNSVRRGKRVTEEILRFTNAVAPVLQIINMGEWLTLIEPELRAVAGSGVKVTVVLPPESVFAPCDAAQMQQVVTNLVINARDAMPSGGAVTLTLATSTRGDNLFIGLSEHERFVHLTVRDTGSGIAPEMLDQIFEPLFTTKRSGTGLGLAVARQVLTQHGGFIFANNAPGGGTAFHIFLPQVDEALSTAVAVAAQKTSGRIRRLLLVEDEVSVAAGLSSLLELEKIVVRVVEQGREVVRAIEEFAPDAVVLDLTLPDIDGREVFAQIAARWPDLPVVFSTGHGGEADLARELSHYHVGFLRKPYEVAVLMAAIERVL